MPMRVLFLNPFHGGSHRAFAEGWARHSRHAIEVHSLPARFWKWRMRGAALHFARSVREPSSFDALVVTDLMSLSDLKALWGAACPPALAYFHENQLSYPLPPGETMDYQFGFTDITTCLSARRVLFNSAFQHEAFFSALPGFIRMMPEFHPRWVIEAIRGRACVLRPGVDLPGGPPDLRPIDPSLPPLVVWNHRWEFDKRPQDFFAALDAVDRRGVPFRLALLGENFQVVPKEFLAARERYGARIIQYGFVESRAAYLDWLRQGTVVVSTAEQENFGMSIVEAVRLGCRPLLPARLSYPELIPPDLHAACFYRDQEDLIERLSAALSRARAAAGTAGGAAEGGARGAAAIAPGDALRLGLSEAMGRFAWGRVVGDFDAELDRLTANDAAMRGPA
jgi:glycosyltransferase involved in cell wall biosynthesis